jgi:probable O-glycosylation ligase (exosortase A-associated)
MTVIAALLGRDRFPVNLRTGLLLAFGIQNVFSTALSPYHAVAWTPFLDFAKVLVMVYLIHTLVTDTTRLRRVFMVIALSLGFEGAKQGWVEMILSPGRQNLNEVAHLGDNNAVAVGMLMVVAMMIALAGTATRRWERHGYQFLALGILYRSLATYSRGGLLAAIAMGLWFLFRSKHKVVALVSLVLACALIMPLLPTAFWERMSTIEEAREDIDSADGSIQGRLHFWNVAVVMANRNPVFGVGNFGFNAAYDFYDPTGGTFGYDRSVHSSWFGTLAELGYPGLIMFVAILITAFTACFRARAAVARGAPKELEAYALALEMGLVAFIVGGSFVVLQYNELVWHFIGLTMVLHALAVARPLASPGTSPAGMTSAGEPAMPPAAAAVLKHA